jgi:large subunit ribosomal protein L16
MRGIATKGNSITYGEFALQSVGRSWVKSNQIESARKVIVRETKRKGKLWIKIFPHKPYTNKPAEVKMGKGKGDVEGYVAVVKPGRVIFELGGIDEATAIKALSEAAHKLPLKTKIITKTH